MKIVNKKCTKCHIVKPSIEFYPREKGKYLTPSCKNCCRKLQRNLRREERIRVIDHYSMGEMRCACCGENEMKFLSLDHIKGGGYQERLKNPKTQLYRSIINRGFPAGFQILCHNCNMAKGLYGVCPHNEKEI